MVKTIRVYIEGGGDGKDTKGKLRQGFDAFFRDLKEIARKKRIRMRLITAGTRNEAHGDFLKALKSHPETTSWILLLVDSEDRLISHSPIEHLKKQDGWDFEGVNDTQIHLMVQAMEAWLLADPDALTSYYGQGFIRNALPSRQDLEEEPKGNLFEALERASGKTQKGSYQKIRHATELLQRISPSKARARCKHCNRLFATVERELEEEA